jgi:hypothetical protein
MVKSYSSKSKINSVQFIKPFLTICLLGIDFFVENAIKLLFLQAVRVSFILWMPLFFLFTFFSERFPLQPIKKLKFIALNRNITSPLVKEQLTIINTNFS